ncbi:MAG: nuclear transport factor 2 family protein [Hyphomonadaceae bacterium]|nr:nuclear transport factor 2 family protein [Hyphomonadaceae bacterium]
MNARLEDIEAIKQLKARYFRTLDTKQWAAWRAVFTDDAAFDGTRRSFNGPDEFCALTSAWLQDAITVHHGHMPEIVFTGPDTARGIWAMFDIVQFPAPTPGSGPYAGNGFIGYGHYEEEYRKISEGWRISLLRLTRLRVDPLPAGSAFAPVPEGLLRSGTSPWL